MYKFFNKNISSKYFEWKKLGDFFFCLQSNFGHAGFEVQNDNSRIPTIALVWLVTHLSIKFQKMQIFKKMNWFLLWSSVKLNFLKVFFRFRKSIFQNNFNLIESVNLKASCGLWPFGKYLL